MGDAAIVMNSFIFFSLFNGGSLLLVDPHFEEEGEVGFPGHAGNSEGLSSSLASS
jgi:hypothetical protein